MVIAGKGFNIYFRLTIALMLLSGCQSPETKRKKQFSMLDIHIETNRDSSDRNKLAPISREHPFMVNIEKTPFLTQNEVQQAKVIDDLGGFALSIQFDRQGSWLLEQYSTGNVGRHFAIFSQFATPPDQKLNKGRWLAAPIIRQRISNGVLVFAPDATREEAEQIALGLNNLAKSLKKKSPKPMAE